MQVVAYHLEEHCWKATNSQERDQFARSAFNRYYYSVYLTIRSALAEIDPNWDEPAHKQVPELLRTTVVARIKKRSRYAVMKPGESEKLVYAGCTAAKALADLIDTGNMTRKVADYEPSRLVVFENSAITLAGVKASSARQWCVYAKSRSRVLVDAAKKLGL